MAVELLGQRVHLPFHHFGEKMNEILIDLKIESDDDEQSVF